MQHGRDHEHRWSHKNRGIGHDGLSDLDPDEQAIEGMTDKDSAGRHAKLRKRLPRARWYSRVR